MTSCRIPAFITGLAARLAEGDSAAAAANATPTAAMPQSPLRIPAIIMSLFSWSIVSHANVTLG
jgi:hypothetical protein